MAIEPPVASHATSGRGMAGKGGMERAGSEKVRESGDKRKLKFPKNLLSRYCCLAGPLL